MTTTTENRVSYYRPAEVPAMAARDLPSNRTWSAFLAGEDARPTEVADAMAVATVPASPYSGEAQAMRAGIVTTMRPADMRLMLAFISGYAPEVFDAAAQAYAPMSRNCSHGK